MATQAPPFKGFAPRKTAPKQPEIPPDIQAMWQALKAGDSQKALAICAGQYHEDPDIDAIVKAHKNGTVSELNEQMQAKTKALRDASEIKEIEMWVRRQNTHTARGQHSLANLCMNASMGDSYAKNQYECYLEARRIKGLDRQGRELEKLPQDKRRMVRQYLEVI